ncbi:hypothetical protein cyc_01767 [Cyclospora cayetanensis]|uniref:DIX domain-containing protein n=1 Tax=Cyclospora cayetanensis TaxID=88456 RepID=A0A1D3CUT2_9EIME|nr:hypothetical protein cyc_01767 [Cyclospora cayetanensis]
MSQILVLYIVTNDGDDPAAPNCFFLRANKGGLPTLKDIKTQFPLPGKYHFRLRTESRQLSGNTSKDEKGTYVWLDLSDDEALPLEASKGMTLFFKIDDYWATHEQQQQRQPVASSGGWGVSPSQPDMLFFDEPPPAAAASAKKQHEGIDLML